GTQLAGQQLTGLTPGVSYHFQFVATNADGTTVGPDLVFTTASLPPPPVVPPVTPPTTPPVAPVPPPVTAVAVDVKPLVGTVLVNGQPLLVGQQIPVGSVVDTTAGTVTLQTVLPSGVVEQMDFAGSVFKVFQLASGLTQLVLQGGDFSACKVTKKGVR